MLPGLIRSKSGFTYIAALFMVVIMGILMGAVGQSVKVIMKREREKELIFRGLQYRDAIERWNKKPNPQPLKDLKDLEKLTQSSNVDRSKDSLIRKLYNDPVTGGEWKALPTPPDPIQGIWGVASTSGDEPFKQANFPEVIKNFEGKKKYSDWEFVYKRTPAGAAPAPGSPARAGNAPQISFPLSTPETN
ncbi:MAG: type II secretion system protein [Geobacteraceae bacterium]|nr:type II secretion system protein [Geobacteraceae bacterium]